MTKQQAANRVECMFEPKKKSWFETHLPAIAWAGVFVGGMAIWTLIILGVRAW